MAGHTAVAFFNVDDDAGRSAGEAADEQITQQGFSAERSSLTIAGEEAVVLANVPGQASMRQVLFVPDERLCITMINSYTLMPTDPSLAPGEASQGSGEPAVVAFVKDEDILLWDEATGQIETIFESGMEQNTAVSRFMEGYTFQLPWGSIYSRSQWNLIGV